MWFNKAAQSLSRIAYPVSRIMNSVGVSILAVMMLLTAADVTLRYLFNRPITSSYELTEFMLAVLIAFGLAYTAVRKGHISIDFLTSRFSPRVQAFLSAISSLMGIGLLSLITWQSIVYAESLRVSGSTTMVLHLPIYPIVWVVVVGSAIFCLVLIVDLLNHLAELVEKGRWLVRAGLLLGIVVVALLVAAPTLGEKMPLQISPFTSAIFGVCFLVVFLFLGIHIGIAMGLLGFLGMSYLTGLGAGLSIMETTPYSTMASHGLSVIPLFILMGTFCFYSGLSRDIYFTMYRWLGHLPGGLAMATVGGCAGFAAVSGSSLATVATMGRVALPEMKKYNYDPGLATGCVAAGGSMGILIPPSIILILYGILTEQSIGKLFIAGFIPGVLEAVFYMATIYIICKHSPLTGPRGERATLTERLVSLKGTWGVLALFLLVIGGIYLGVFTPTEAAGVGAFGSFLFALGKRQLTWRSFIDSLTESGKISAMLFLILIGATLFSYFLAVTRLPDGLAGLISGLAVNRYMILGIILLVYLVFGAITSVVAVVVLTIPIFFPVIVALGFHPIWFGIIIVRLIEIGQITPPVALNVYAMKSVAPDIPLSTMFRGIIPFLIADIFHVALLIAIPQISLFLIGFMK